MKELVKEIKAQSQKVQAMENKTKTELYRLARLTGYIDARCLRGGETFLTHVWGQAVEYACDDFYAAGGQWTPEDYKICGQTRKKFLSVAAK